ncbi:glycosyltransferase family 4 protein [Canibacter sp. lx-72]|uniref:glycosyltransferase family 4 protein n=1 Tax=Canibacter zhuwentaonis TaxID=2837491 RepID=UPI001BDD1E36|nr:glycosyltransferase family 4 protein [Canibacter zhuwentaonis]
MRIAFVIDYSLTYLGGAQSAFLDQAAALRQSGHEIVIIAPDMPLGFAGESPGNELPDHKSHGHESATHKLETGEFAVCEPAAGESFSPNRSDSAAAQLASAYDFVTVASAGTIPVLGLPLIRNTARLRARLKRLLQHKNIDIVHSHSEFGLTTAAREVAAQLGVPTVFTVHTFFWQARLRGVFDLCAAGAVRAFARFITGSSVSRPSLTRARADNALRTITLQQALAADLVVSPSTHQRFCLQQAGVENVVVLPNPMSPAGFDMCADREPERAGQPHDTAGIWQRGEPTGVGQAYGSADAWQPPLRLVWVGRVVPEKRLLEFLAGFKLACQKHGQANFRLTVVGEGELLSRAKRAAAQLPVVFTGRLTREQVRAQMERAHAVVLSSYGFDNQPVTVVEAVSLFRPVVLCDPLITEGLTAGSGIYAAGETPCDFARLLGELLAEPERLQRAALATRQDREVFYPHIFCEKLVAEYRCLCVGKVV